MHRDTVLAAILSFLTTFVFFGLNAYWEHTDAQLAFVGAAALVTHAHSVLLLCTARAPAVFFPAFFDAVHLAYALAGKLDARVSFVFFFFSHLALAGVNIVTAGGGILLGG